jgi:hypothetical protein
MCAGLKTRILAFLAMLALPGCQTSGTLGGDVSRSVQDIMAGVSFDWPSSAQGLSVADVTAAFRQALQMGAAAVSGRLGQKDGFRLDSFAHIPLPEKMASVQSQLKKVGLSAPLDDLELRLNRGAEAAMPHVKDVFWYAISQMTFQDVMEIYNGAPNAATLYFQRTTSAMLAEKIRPVAQDAITCAGVFDAYRLALSRQPLLSALPDPQASLTNYVTEKSLSAVFHYLAEEESAIRQDPVRQTTELLKKVFGRRTAD